MTTYARPAITSPVFRDADGHVLDYGNRWDGPPPENTYSVDTHPERFAPLHAVADELIAHLRVTYDVDIEDGPETAADLLHPPYHDVVRAVRVRPRDPACAAVTLVFTAYPGIYLHAGLLNDFHYPICGCDACDSNWPSEADALEQQVLAIVSGQYRETLERRGADLWVEHAFTYPDGASSGGSLERAVPPARLEAAETTLRATPSWTAWPQAVPTLG